MLGESRRKIPGPPPTSSTDSLSARAVHIPGGLLPVVARYHGPAVHKICVAGIARNRENAAVGSNGLSWHGGACGAGMAQFRTHRFPGYSVLEVVVGKPSFY